MEKELIELLKQKVRSLVERMREDSLVDFMRASDREMVIKEITEFVLLQSTISSLKDKKEEWVKVKATKDCSGHWHLIPNEQLAEFNELDYKCDRGNEDACMESDNKFAIYRTGGDLNLTQLYIKIP